MSIKVIIDSFFTTQGFNSNLEATLKSCGAEIYVSDHIRHYNENLYLPYAFLDITENVFVYGSIQFVEDMTNNYRHITSFYNPDRFEVSEYLSTIPVDYFLNSSGTFTTFGIFKSNPDKFFGNTEGVFIRPNSGKKIFTGLVITKENFLTEIRSLEQLSSVMDNTMIYVSPTKEIKREYRTIIVGNKVLSACQYMEDGELLIIKDPPNLDKAVKTAQLIADIEEHNRPDAYLVCDVAETVDGDFKILELNSLSTSDLYECSPKSLYCAFEHYVNEYYR